VAFKYLFQFPDIVPIPGIERTHEIEEIVGILEGPLEMTEAEQREMQRMRDELGTRFCRRCDYCQPCPQEIPISLMMFADTAVKRIPADRLFASRFFAEAVDKAANCTECGDCEEKCPYDLPIREILAEQVRYFREAKQKYEQGTAA
ncbi:MAG: 4Fe-4S dicluster domain-containing protein, partial [Dehalococcoidia bacterium]